MKIFDHIIFFDYANAHVAQMHQYSRLWSEQSYQKMISVADSFLQGRISRSKFKKIFKSQVFSILRNSDSDASWVYRHLPVLSDQKPKNNTELRSQRIFRYIEINKVYYPSVSRIFNVSIWNQEWEDWIVTVDKIMYRGEIRNPPETLNEAYSLSDLRPLIFSRVTDYHKTERRRLLPFVFGD